MRDCSFSHLCVLISIRSMTIEEEDGSARPDGSGVRNVSLLFSELHLTLHESVNTYTRSPSVLLSRASRATTKPSTNSSLRSQRRRIWNTVSFHWKIIHSELSSRLRYFSQSVMRVNEVLCFSDVSSVSEESQWCLTLCSAQNEVFNKRSFRNIKKTFILSYHNVLKVSAQNHSRNIFVLKCLSSKVTFW